MVIRNQRKILHAMSVILIKFDDKIDWSNRNSFAHLFFLTRHSQQQGCAENMLGRNCDASTAYISAAALLENDLFIFP